MAAIAFFDLGNFYYHILLYWVKYLIFCNVLRGDPHPGRVGLDERSPPARAFRLPTCGGFIIKVNNSEYLVTSQQQAIAD